MFWVIATIVGATVAVIVTIVLSTHIIAERLEGLIKVGMRRE